MKKTFTKTDLQTGDIVEARNGERGVVILEKNCILYQGGGLDELYVFTEDLFVDGLERAGNIFKIYRDPTDPIGFNRLSGSILVFTRINNKKTKARAAELNEIHDEKKNKVLVYPMYPSYRRCGKQYIGNSRHPRGFTEIDLSLSFAPSETAWGRIKLDRTYIPLPDAAENLYILYNKYQKDWLMDAARCYKDPEDLNLIFAIPEKTFIFTALACSFAWIRMDS